MAQQGKNPKVKLLNNDYEYYKALQQKLLEECG
jgi:predicted house-cleaning noncanonical NTP pyrophosphatase (MazG superfamily)